MSGQKQYLYHATTPENAEKIRKDGLRRMQSPFVCLSEKPTSWWKPGLVVLKVRITGLTGEIKTWLPESDEINYWGDINPERISRQNVVLPRRFIQNHMSGVYLPNMEKPRGCGDCWHDANCDRWRNRNWGMPPPEDCPIEAAPTGVVEVRHGRWIKSPECPEEYDICSVCGKNDKHRSRGDWEHDTLESVPPFCKWCGAKMDLKDGGAE